MGATNPQRIQELEQTFQVFNQVSRELEISYHQLEDKVSQLQGRLAESASEIHPEKNTPGTVVDGSARLNAILTALPAGVVVLDGAGRIQHCNPAAIKLLGEPLLGEAWTHVIGRAFAPRSDDGHEISLKNGRRVSISTCPLGNEPGQVLLLTDVTETRELQDKLSQHQRLIAMGEMAAGLAHQIRTPLASGLLLASQLKNSSLEPDKQKIVAGKVITQLRQLESLIDDMLMFSRNGYGGEEEINIHTLVDNLIASIRNVCDQRHVSLDVISDFSNDSIFERSAPVYPASECIIRGNPRILHSALQNLANNAIQAMGYKGKLQIHLRPGVCDTLEICVIDDGPGIPAEYQDKLFKPFFTTRSDGTGLGLAVVQAIVRAHNGCVRLESTGERGSQFIVQLPIYKFVENKDVVVEPTSLGISSEE